VSPFETLKVQHGEILEMISEVLAQLPADRLPTYIANIRSSLAILAGKVSVHLAVEDKVLYPHLLQSANHEIKNLARSFVAEMGGIAQQFAEYRRKWADLPDIHAQAEDFIQETRTLMTALAWRIEREDERLYPLLEK